MYNVMIVDDQLSSQKLMEHAVERGKDRYAISKLLSNADMVLNELKYNQPDLILLDIYTNGKENGIFVAEQVKELYPNIKIIILTFLIQKRHVDEAKKIGCEGFWYKDHADIDLLTVMDNVMNGHPHYPDSQPVVVIGTAKSSDFTARELQILQAKINGVTPDDICKLLGIKRPTLNTHIANIKNKTGYTSLIRLIVDIVDKKFIIATEKSE